MHVRMLRRDRHRGFPRRRLALPRIQLVESRHLGSSRICKKGGGKRGFFERYQGHC